MELQEIIAKIDMKRISNNTFDITVTMPIWKHIGSDNKTYITLALLGGIQTCVESDDDIDNAITEALKLFFNASQKYGKGFQHELKVLGWQSKKNHIRFKAPRK